MDKINNNVDEKIEQQIFSIKNMNNKDIDAFLKGTGYKIDYGNIEDLSQINKRYIVDHDSIVFSITNQKKVVQKESWEKENEDDGKYNCLHVFKSVEASGLFYLKFLVFKNTEVLSSKKITENIESGLLKSHLVQYIKKMKK